MAELYGYSGKSLIAKLGLKPGERLVAVDAPDHYPALVAPLPEGAVLQRQSFEAPFAPSALVHAFFRSSAALTAHADSLSRAPTTGLWVSWLKKSSPLHQDLTEDGLREVLLPTGWVDVKVAAVDSDWSALKFLRRRT